MSKARKWSLIFLCIAAAAFLCAGMIRLGMRQAPAPDSESDNSPGASLSMPESESGALPAESESGGEDEPQETGAPVLALYTTDLPNNIGKVGYTTQEMGDGSKRVDVYRGVLESYHLVPYTDENGAGRTLATGHRVYVKSDDRAGQQYVVSGVDLIPVEHGVPDTRMTVKLRAEDTCERIRVFTSEEDMERAQTAWERGQRILAGEEEAPAGCVILDGCLLDSVRWEQGEDGRIYLPMTDVAEAYDEQSEFYELEGWLNVAVDLQYVILPTALAPDIVLEHFDVSDGTWLYASDKSPLWSDRFYLPQTEKTEMPVEDISRILGWEIYTGSGIVNIVTSELDANDNFVLIKTRTTEHIYDLNGNEITEARG